MPNLNPKLNQQQDLDYDAWFRARTLSAQTEAADPAKPRYTPEAWQAIRNAKMIKAEKLGSIFE